MSFCLSTISDPVVFLLFVVLFGFTRSGLCPSTLEARVLSTEAVVVDRSL